MKLLWMEIKFLLHSRWNRMLFFVLPLSITVYLCLLFSQGTVSGIKTVIVDQDNSAYSRQLIQYFAQHDKFLLRGTAASFSEGIELIAREQADVCLAIPAGFGSKLQKNIPAEVGIMVDTGNMALSSAALKAATDIVLGFNKETGSKVLSRRDFLPDTAGKLLAPLRIQLRTLVNPAGNFGDFLLLGLIGAVCHFPVLLLAALALHATPDLPGAKGPGPALAVILKIAALGVVGSILLLSCLAAAMLIYPLTWRAGLLVPVLLGSVFAFTASSLGVLISALLPDKTTATQAAMVVALPALLLSGYTWPLQSMPWLIRILGLAEPLTYMVNPLREAALSGTAPASLRPGIAAMLLMQGCFTLAAIFLYAKKVERWKTAVSAG